MPEWLICTSICGRSVTHHLTNPWGKTTISVCPWVCTACTFIMREEATLHIPWSAQIYDNLNRPYFKSQEIPWIWFIKNYIISNVTVMCYLILVILFINMFCHWRFLATVRLQVLVAMQQQLDIGWTNGEWGSPWMEKALNQMEVSMETHPTNGLFSNVFDCQLPLPQCMSPNFFPCVGPSSWTLQTCRTDKPTLCLSQKRPHDFRQNKIREIEANGPTANYSGPK